MTCRALFTSVLMLVLTISVHAQSLEDVAARERDRRARQSPGVPSYDDQDLNKGKPSPSPSSSPSAPPRPSVPATQAAPMPGTATPAPGRIRGGRLPSPRPTATPRPTPSAAPSAGPSAAPSAGPSAGPSAAPAAVALPSPSPPPAAAGPEASEAYWRGRARDLREAVTNAERQVAALESRVNALRNDMAPMDAMQASREQQRRADLGQAIAELEQAKATVARGRQALDDLEDEARRKGALPGWLRE